MNKIKFSLPDSMTPQARVALGVTTVLLGVLVLFDIYSTYNYLNSHAKTQLLAMSLSLAMTVVAGIGAWMSWHGRVARAGWVLIAGSLASLLFSNLLGGGFSTIYALTGLVVVTSIAGTMLPGSQAGWAILLSVISGVAGILMESYLPAQAASEGSLPRTFTYAMLILLIIGELFIMARQARKYSLRTKLLISGLLLTLLSVGALGFTNNYYSRANLTASAGLSLKSLANTQAQAISNVLLQEARVLGSFSLSKLIQDSVDDSNASYGPNQALNQAKLDRLDAEWRIADTANNDFVPIVREALNNEAASELREFRSAFPENAEVFVTDRYGALVASTNRTSDYYQADEGWWQAAYNNGTGDFYFGQPEYDDSSQTFGLILAIPLYAHGTREVNGVLRTTININAVVTILGAEILDGTGQADLYLPDQLVLDPEQPTGLVAADPQALIRLQSLIESNTSETFKYEDDLGIVSAATVSPLDSEEGATAIENLGWVVVVHQDEVASLAPLQKQNRSTLLISLAILALGALVAVYVAQTLSAPIVRLTAVAQQISAGDNTAQAKVETEDEIGTLARTFNAMTAQLREFISSLEQRVAERTKDLESAQQQMTRRASELATVAEVGTAASTILDVNLLLQNVVELSKERFGLYHAHIYLLDESDENLVLTAGAGEPGRIMSAEKRSIPLNREQSLVARAARERKGVTVNDVTQAPDFLPNPLLPNTRAELAVPLIVGDKVLGVFDVQSDQVGRFSETDVYIQSTLASQVAIALQNARAFSQAQKQAERETTLNLIGQKIQGTTTVEAALQVAARELGRALGAPLTVAQLGLKPERSNSN